MASLQPPSLSLVIPVYGSEPVLPELVRRLQAMFDQQARPSGDYELILVCDCSPDRSWAVI
ncbi:MAG: glycosyltransferase, partial [Rhodoferax sp.]|nr:glycosyltransferase [Rhodoferax sp.]